MQQLRYSTSAAAADGLTREPRAHALQLVRRLERSHDAAFRDDPLAALADFFTALRSPDGETVAAAAAAAGAVEALERMMRGEVEGTRWASHVTVGKKESRKCFGIVKRCETYP